MYQGHRKNEAVGYRTRRLFLMLVTSGLAEGKGIFSCTSGTICFNRIGIAACICTYFSAFQVLFQIGHEAFYFQFLKV